MGEAESDEDWIHVNFQSGSAHDEYRRLAASENDALAVEHQRSLKHEQSIADEMESFDRHVHVVGPFSAVGLHSTSHSVHGPEPFGELSGLWQ